MQRRPVYALFSGGFLVCCMIALSACTRVQTVDFSVDPTSGAKPLSVQFAPLVDGSVREWLWSFGDGTGSNERSAEHTYLETGLYTVFLRVTPWFGESVTTVKEDCIHVKSAGFLDAPGRLLAVDDTVGLAYCSSETELMHGYDYQYIIDVLANDVLPPPPARVTIVGVADSADGPFIRWVQFPSSYDKEYFAVEAAVSRDGTYVGYGYNRGALDVGDDARTFYYQISDGSQTSVAKVTTDYYDSPAH